MQKSYLPNSIPQNWPNDQKPEIFSLFLKRTEKFLTSFCRSKIISLYFQIEHYTVRFTDRALYREVFRSNFWNSDQALYTVRLSDQALYCEILRSNIVPWGFHIKHLRLSDRALYCVTLRSNVIPWGFHVEHYTVRLSDQTLYREAFTSGIIL